MSCALSPAERLSSLLCAQCCIRANCKHSQELENEAVEACSKLSEAQTVRGRVQRICSFKHWTNVRKIFGDPRQLPEDLLQIDAFAVFKKFVETNPGLPYERPGVPVTTDKCVESRLYNLRSALDLLGISCRYNCCEPVQTGLFAEPINLRNPFWSDSSKSDLLSAWKFRINHVRSRCSELPAGSPDAAEPSSTPSGKGWHCPPLGLGLAGAMLVQVSLLPCWKPGGYTILSSSPFRKAVLISICLTVHHLPEEQHQSCIFLSRRLDGARPVMRRLVSSSRSAC